MFNQNLYFRRYPRFTYNRFNNFNTTYPYLQSNVQPNQIESNNIQEIEIVENNIENLDGQKNENNSTTEESKNFDNTKNEKSSRTFGFGPIQFCNNELSIFGFTLQIDDLIILGIILLLLIESDCDYALIIVLGLMFFNISFSSLNLF